MEKDIKEIKEQLIKLKIENYKLSRLISNGHHNTQMIFYDSYYGRKDKVKFCSNCNIIRDEKEILNVGNLHQHCKRCISDKLDELKELNKLKDLKKKN